MYEEFAKAFMMLFVIIDAFGVLPVFIALTKDFTQKEKLRAAKHATVVAGILMILFIFLGKTLLNFFGINIGSFQIAGGIILLIMGIMFVLDIKFKHAEKGYAKDITVPIATPLITGAGVLTTVIILVTSYGWPIVLAAAILNLIICWLVMYYSGKIHKVLGYQGSEILSRIMGIILAGFAIQFIINGIKSAFF